MSEIKHILRIMNDPDRDPVAFKLEMERILNMIMEQVDTIQGLRGEPKFYADINVQENKINFNDEGYLRLEDLQKKLQYYDKPAKTWRDIQGAELLDRLTSQVGANSTLILTDNGVNQTLTGSLGDITIDPAGGDVHFSGNITATGYYTGDVRLKSTVEDVTSSRALGVVYQNVSSSTKIIHATLEISAGTLRITTDTTLDYSYQIIYCDTDGGAITATLPAGEENRMFKLINCGSSGYDLTIDGDGSETIYGQSTVTVSDGEIVEIHYNTTEGWW